MLTGPAIDQQLAGAGALAQTVDGATILLSSQLTALSEVTQSLVVGHELAHTVQLSRGGSDAAHFLEQEAWLAARCALRGVRYRIRGGASQPLCAIAFIENDAHPKAMQYFRSFPKEPVARAEWMPIDSIVAVPSMTFIRLLEAMLKTYGGDGGKDALIVTHGGAKGLTMGLDAGTRGERSRPASAYTEALEVLLNAELQSEKKAEILYLTQRRLASLEQTIMATHKLELQRVEFRACNIGKDVVNLQWLAKVFGARSAGAPDVYDAYNSLHPKVTQDKKAWASWHKEHTGAKIYQGPGGKFALYTKRISNTQFTADAIAESRASVQQWITEHLPAPGSNSSTGEFPIHVLWPDLIFPRDSEYTDHITRYTV